MAALVRLRLLEGLVVLRVLRDRVLEVPRLLELPDRLLPDLLELDEEVLLLREPGGEDVRVAMLRL